jgi:flagellar basal body-associated protein FliL
MAISKASDKLAETLQTNRTASILIGGLVVVALAVLAVVLVRHGNQARAAAEAQIAEEIGQESRAFCTNFGIGPEALRHAECTKALMEIRKRHQERTAGDMIGAL